MNNDPSPFFLMSIDRSRATTVSGVLDLLGSRAPARSTISRTDIGIAVSRRISSTTASVLICSGLRTSEKTAPTTVENEVILAPVFSGNSLDISFYDNAIKQLDTLARN